MKFILKFKHNIFINLTLKFKHNFFNKGLEQMTTKVASNLQE